MAANHRSSKFSVTGLYVITLVCAYAMSVSALELSGEVLEAGKFSLKDYQIKRLHCLIQPEPIEPIFGQLSKDSEVFKERPERWIKRKRRRARAKLANLRESYFLIQRGRAYKRRRARLRLFLRILKQGPNDCAGLTNSPNSSSSSSDRSYSSSSSSSPESSSSSAISDPSSSSSSTSSDSSSSSSADSSSSASSESSSEGSSSSVSDQFVDHYLDTSGIDPNSTGEYEHQGSVTKPIYLGNGEIVPDDATVLTLHLNNDFLDSSPLQKQVTVVDDVEFDPDGRLAQAAALDGAGSYVDLGAMPELEGQAELSFAVWVKSATESTNGAKILSKRGGGSSNQTLELLWRANETFAVDLYTATEGRKSVFSGAVSDTDWHHLAAVYNGSRLTFYVDGYSVGSVDASGLTATSSGSLKIGSSWYGLIDEVAIWQRVLSESEVLALANASTHGGGFDSVSISLGDTYNAITASWLESAPGNTSVFVSDSGTTWCRLTNSLRLTDTECPELPASQLRYRVAFHGPTELDRIQLDWEDYIDDPGGGGSSGSSSSSPPIEVNLLENPGFEDGQDHWTANWGSQVTVIPTNGETRSGENAIHFHGSSGDHLQAFQDVAEVLPGGDYYVSGWVWLRRAGGMRTSVNWLDSSGNLLESVDLSAFGSIAKTDLGDVAYVWQNFFGTITAPAGATTARLLLRAKLRSDVESHIIFDDLEFGESTGLSCEATDTNFETVYVDNELYSDCLDGTYSVSARTCGSGQDGRAYRSFSSVSQARPGETWQIRSSSHDYQASNIRFSWCGRPGALVTVMGYPGDPRPRVRVTGRYGFEFLTPGAGGYVFKDLVIFDGTAAFRFSPQGLPRIKNIRLEGLELFDFGKSAIRAEYYGVENLYVKDCQVHDAHDTEGGFDFKVNGRNYACGAGSRQVVIQDTEFYHHTNQQSSGTIAQNSAEDFIYINNRGWENGELLIGSKAGGHNILIGNVGWNQGKAAFYLRDPYKLFDGAVKIDEIEYPRVNIIHECGPSNYLLANNAGITRESIAGDQGAMVKWPDVNLWAYNNTFVSLENHPEANWVGGAVSIHSGLSYAVTVQSKNNLFYRANNPDADFIVNLGDYTSSGSLTWIGDGNIYFGPNSVPDNEIIRDHPHHYTLQEFREETEYENHSLLGNPDDHGSQFSFFDESDDTILHNLRPLADSLTIDSGRAYDVNDSNDYPNTASQFLAEFSSAGTPEQAFSHFAVLSEAERVALRSTIEEAYLRDIDGNPRGEAPDIGAFEANPAPFIAGAVPAAGSHLQHLSSLQIHLADNLSGVTGSGDLDVENSFLESAKGPSGETINITDIQRQGGGLYGIVTLNNIPDLGDGAYSFSFTAVDLAGNSSTDTVVAYLDRTPPNAQIREVIHAPAGDNEYRTVFDARDSSDNLSIVLYEWDADNDGLFDFTGDGWDGSVPTKTAKSFYTAPGTYEVRVRVTDRAGNQSVSPVYLYTISE